MFHEKNWWGEDQYARIGQLRNYKNLLDMTNAIRYDYAQYRLPKPGKEIKVKSAEEQVKQVEDEWRKESINRNPGNNFYPSPEFTALNKETKCYLHAILEIVDYYHSENENMYGEGAVY